MLYSRKQTDVVRYDNIEYDDNVIELVFIIGMTLLLSMMLIVYIILW